MKNREGTTLTTECCRYTENAKLRRGAGRNLVARASVAVAGIRRVVVVEGVASHEPKDVEQAMGDNAVSLGTAEFTRGHDSVDKRRIKREKNTYGTWVKLKDREIKKPASRMRFSTWNTARRQDLERLVSAPPSRSSCAGAAAATGAPAVSGRSSGVLSSSADIAFPFPCRCTVLNRSCQREINKTKEAKERKKKKKCRNGGKTASLQPPPRFSLAWGKGGEQREAYPGLRRFAEVVELRNVLAVFPPPPPPSGRAGDESPLFSCVSGRRETPSDPPGYKCNVTTGVDRRRSAPTSPASVEGCFGGQAKE